MANIHTICSDTNMAVITKAIYIPTIDPTQGGKRWWWNHNRRLDPSYRAKQFRGCCKNGSDSRVV